MSYFEHNLSYIVKIILKTMDEEDLDEFIYEFHERVLGIIPERRLDWEYFCNNYAELGSFLQNVPI